MRNFALYLPSALFVFQFKCLHSHLYLFCIISTTGILLVGYDYRYLLLSLRLAIALSVQRVCNVEICSESKRHIVMSQDNVCLFSVFMHVEICMCVRLPTLIRSPPHRSSSSGVLLWLSYHPDSRWVAGRADRREVGVWCGHRHDVHPDPVHAYRGHHQCVAFDRCASARGLL